MKLSTPIPTVPDTLRIGFETPVLLLGSCFSDEIGTRMARAGMQVLCNPFGTLFNPCSISRCLRYAVEGHTLSDNDMVQHDGLWHSWLHSTHFSHGDKGDCRQHCNDSLHLVAQFVKRKPVVVCTFGTAYVFTLAESPDTVVANCHKLPADRFVRRRLTIADCSTALDEIVSCLPPDTPLIYSVSPIRHLADGAHGNQLSKATLLLAIDRQQQGNYFPAYEILLDELRDYRFFARDMVHPSDLAADIIWERFQLCYMDEHTRQQILEGERSYRHNQHRSISE